MICDRYSPEVPSSETRGSLSTFPSRVCLHFRAYCVSSASMKDFLHQNESKHFWGTPVRGILSYNNSFIMAFFDLHNSASIACLRLHLSLRVSLTEWSTSTVWFTCLVGFQPNWTKSGWSLTVSWKNGIRQSYVSPASLVFSLIVGRREDKTNHVKPAAGLFFSLNREEIYPSSIIIIGVCNTLR